MIRSRPAFRETAWVDYVLTAALGAQALYCCGQGVAQPAAGWILIGIYLLGTAFSFVVGTRMRQTRFAAFDGPFYAVAAAVAVFGQPILDQFLPADTFPPELRSAGLLSWLLCLGSFAGWRDATRLFQAVPGLALFGLIGVYDTYPPAPFLFFGFLLCLAFMFGRAHARSMLIQASRSGFSRVEEGLSLSEAAAEQDSMLRAMRRGPWRWMAGPEWAVASAGAVTLVSLLGAPIIKDSVQSVAGFVRFNLPQRLRQRARGNYQQPLTPESLQRIGQGPRRLTATVVGVAELDRPRYLRSGIFELYLAGAWSESLAQFDPAAQGIIASDLAEIDHPKRYHFQVSMVDNNWAIRMPAPAQIEQITDPPGAELRVDGTVSLLGGTSIEGTAVESQIQLNSATPVEYKTAREALTRPATTARVHAFAQSAIAAAKTDYDKAIAIMKAIDQHAKYNLKSEAVPLGQDPVDYFLFTSHEGYCDLFASSMVVLARDAGMDAHYVIGYLTRGDDTDDEGRYILRQSDAHSWAEIYFDKIGWVVFDPTAGAEEVTPKDQSDMARLATTWVPVIGGVALLVCLIYFASRVKLTLRMPVIAKRQRKLDRLYGKFAQRLGSMAKLRKPMSVTPDAWIEMTKPRLGAIAGLAEELNAKFVRALYSSEASNDEQIAALKAAYRNFKRAKR